MIMSKFIFGDNKKDDFQLFLNKNKNEKNVILSYIIKELISPSLTFNSNYFIIRNKTYNHFNSNYFKELDENYYKNIKNSFEFIFHEIENKLKEDDYIYIMKNLFEYLINIYNYDDENYEESYILYIILNLIYNIIENKTLLDNELIIKYFKISFNNYN